MVNFDDLPLTETSPEHAMSRKSMKKTRRLSWASLIVALTTLAALWPLIGRAWGFASGIAGTPAAGAVNARGLEEQRAALAKERADRVAAIEKERADRTEAETQMMEMQARMDGKLDVLIGRGR